MTRWWSQLSAKDRRALGILGVALAAAALYLFWPAGGTDVVQTASTESVDSAEQRLVRLRRLAATVPAKEAVLKDVNAELALREKGLIRADTGAQAQAQLIQILKQLGQQEDPHVELRSIQLGPLTPLGDSYGVAYVSVLIECRIEQLVNFLAASAARQELIFPQSIEIAASNPKEKTLRVTLTVGGMIPKALVAKPTADKKGANAF